MNEGQRRCMRRGASEEVDPVARTRPMSEIELRVGALTQLCAAQLPRGNDGGAGVHRGGAFVSLVECGPIELAPVNPGTRWRHPRAAMSGRTVRWLARALSRPPSLAMPISRRLILLRSQSTS